MFDEKNYLTGENGRFETGDTFVLQAAKPTGKVKINGVDRDEVALRIEGETYYTSGRGIVNQVARMAAGDLPAQVVIVEKETANGAMHLLERVGTEVPNQAAPVEATTEGQTPPPAQ